MKWKLLGGGLLVVTCVSLLAMKGISQGPPPGASFDSASPFSPPPGTRPSPPPEKTFEQLAEDLKEVRVKQKALKAQEEDILKRMAASVDAKRKDLEKAEEVLRQLQGKPDERNRIAPPSRQSPSAEK